MSAEFTAARAQLVHMIESAAVIAPSIRHFESDGGYGRVDDEGLA